VRRDLIYLFLILAIAFAVRVFGPWETVFAAGRVNFLENDAWYHVRLIENQVRNWPWRVTLDPYAAPGGQFVAIAPFFDTLTATVAVLLYGRHADATSIERIAAFVPPVLGTLTVLGVWALGLRAFDRRAALLGAALLAVLPGHFLDRTLLGFYDHHALEACLAIATLWAVAMALGDRPKFRRPVLAGIFLGLYLLGWSSGAFLVAILGFWLLLCVLIVRTSAELTDAARVIGPAALIAFVLVVAFQDPSMFRYESQVLGLAALAGMALAIATVSTRTTPQVSGRRIIYGAILIVMAIAVAVLWTFSRGVVEQLITDVARLRPDPTRMAVLEARPLFLYPGAWSWKQPWEFFRTGFFVGLVGLVVFSARVWHGRRPLDVLIWVFVAAMFAATYGQNRFGYYLVPACALIGGWLATVVLDWGGVPQRETLAPPERARLPLQREATVIIVAGLFFAPNLVPAVLVTSRATTLPTFWANTMTWLRDHTAPPFLVAAQAGDEYYYARYPRAAVPPPDYSVMNWWDHGYWVTQLARRVPVANPTQARASNAARFYASTNERDALEILSAERGRYVITDWELPFRLERDERVMGRFQNVLDWAGAEHARYYEVYYRRQNRRWIPAWVFHEPYYRSMTFRLMVLGAAAALPSRTTTVVVVADRVDETGFRFKEIVSQVTFDMYEEALRAAETAQSSGHALVVGLDPWRTAFPTEALTSLHEIYAARTAEQKLTESPWVRIFERRDQITKNE
jgi:dolichyl-diphosphooligosaccharide--protein glycosyltransferase